MDEKKKSVSSNALMYGALVAAAGIVYSMILYIADLSMNNALQYVTYLFYIGGMILGTLQYRKLYQNDFMTYSQAVKNSFLIGFFASLMLAVFSFIFFKFIDPGMIDRIIEMTRNKMTEANPQMTEEQIEKALSISGFFTNAYVLPIMTIITSSIFSIIFALILGIFLKKEDAQQQSTN
jgi:hypothetical protein